MHLLQPDEVDRLALGVVMLGSGGGGGEHETHAFAAMLRQEMRQSGPVTVLSPEEADPDGYGARVGLIGAPTVMIEKLPSGLEAEQALNALQGHDDTAVTAVIGWEVGGCNGLLPLVLAARLGLPYVDVDGMGRAFPRIDQTTYDAAGLPTTPLAITEPSGNRAVLDATGIEKLARTVMVDFGGWAMMVAKPLRLGDALEAGVRGSLTRALRLGEIWSGRADSVEQRAAASGGFLVARGKVVEVWRESVGDFPRGTVALRRLDADDAYVRLEMQGEYLAALADGETLVTTPDLLCCLDAESGAPVSAERLTFGAVIDVVALPSPEQWLRREVLGRVDPRAFGYDLDYVPFRVSA
ncbi:DUF917 domain-containing protein [Nocardia sp. NRRL S-836]|uniref:DUF917 domain-containing protein n=1 Tax=Nocardia sp. NRRL S-836 TaxID=1519492 RepID=UPI0006AD9039|nr:DUF917 domain-containing protein [Nocardia sp. NRRL S-836]KOV84144.1 hypothetical protein ADL03_18040 [Nocardia sp. NRRL S-836]